MTNEQYKKAYEKAYDKLAEMEDHYFDLAYKALEKGNLQANLMRSSEGSAFGRARWILEDCFNEEEQ